MALVTLWQALARSIPSKQLTDKGEPMHQHQQTIADLERMDTPSALEIAAYAVALVAGTVCALLFVFTI